MNPTLRSLLFWMVLVVVGVLIWNFSTDFQTRDTAQTFSEFVVQVEQGQVDSVTMTGNEISGMLKNGDRFR
ncbi:MAG: ATP-dependent metallopeptidase FtsH/Yme1/Tma family protein, partial [Acidobacteriota bacterium]|nr:ATP-dependent metallopeptidase FtsH/Yme1/Tma family protein [Acidobacteriota bacterium]